MHDDLRQAFSIVRLTEEDVEELHGGSLFDHNGSGPPNMIWDCAFRGEFDLPLLFDMAKMMNETTNPMELVQSHLRSLDRSLAVFKNGHVEPGRIRFRALHSSALFPGATESTSYARGLHGSYSIESNELDLLVEHVASMKHLPARME